MAMDISKDVPNVLSPSKPETMSRLDQTASIGHELMESGIRVYVRIRPFSKKEISELGTECISVVEVSSCRKKVTLFESTSSNVARGEFTFDYCVSPFQTEQILLSDNNPLSDGDDDDEIDEEDQAEIAQEEMYALAGGPILQSSWNGFNGCVFAYGQTSSGKTYTMMGTKRDPGIIPRLCRQLFELYENSQSSKKERTTSIQVTFIEIYNEQVRDLLRPKPKKGGVRYTSRFDANPTDTSEYQTLKVRQHPLHGPFVEGITKQVVDSWTQCVQLMKSGNELRVQAQTDMNETSSRSHAIFQMIITHTEALGAKVRGRSVTNHKVSKLNLVDLAGSERMVRSGVTGKQVAEANHINLSLSTLRRVIDALLQNTKSKNSAKKAVIPYRESMLTWILSDNFGGNSKTIMIATVSPAASSWHETEGTLRYATLARGVTNRVKVNEDPSTKIIRELKTQLKALQDEISSVRNTTITSQTDELKQIAQEERMKELQEQIELNERVMDDLLTRENALRKEMDEYKAREQELLKRQEELMKGEIYWRQRAEELTEQSMKLKFELDTLRTGDGPPNLQRKNVSELFWSTLGTTDQPPSEYETSRIQSILAKKRSMRKEKIVAAATAAAVEAEKKSFRVVRPEKVLLTSAEETLSPIVDDLAASCSVHDPEFGEWVEEKMDSEWKSLGPQHGRRAHNLPTSPNPTNAVKSPEQKEISTTLRESSVLNRRRGSEIRGLRAYVIDVPSTTVHMCVQNVAPVTDVLDQFVGEKELFGSKRSTKNTKH